MGCCKKKIVVAGSTIVLLAQVMTPEDDLLTPDEVDAVSVELDDVTTESTPVDANGDEIADGSAFDEPDKADVVLDPPQTDRDWPDSTGYNIAYKIKLPLRDKIYDVRLTLELTSGDTEVVLWDGIDTR